MKKQCLYYALDKWEETGGYIMFRKSTHWCMPYVLHLDEKTNKLTHYVPPEDLKYPWYFIFGFDGYIKEFDHEKCMPMNIRCMFFGTISLVILGLVWYTSRLFTRKNNRRNNRRNNKRSTLDRRGLK